jgi:hypothetical protein
MSKVDARVDDSRGGQLGGRRQSFDIPDIILDFEDLVRLAQAQKLSQNEASEVTRLASNVLLTWDTTSRDGDRSQFITAFRTLWQSDRRIARRIYEHFLRTEILDQETLRSTLHIPQRKRRRRLR